MVEGLDEAPERATVGAAPPVAVPRAGPTYLYALGRIEPRFLVVFKGCSGEAPHCAHANTAEIHPLLADILRTC